ncbi:MAG TPA: S41 family peptidase [Candidatus Limnocylindria bacterium]|jgi:carboxyl-terminal processing protease|nr:S41 family peptidase [Candidatus Limnocylindria bacterium]
MRIRALPLLLVVAFVASACGLLPADLQHELLPSQTQYKTAEAAYSVLVERHIDKPTPQQLIPGALDGVTKYLKDAQIDAVPNVDRPTLTGSVWSDFAKFTASLDAVAQRYPTADKALMERAAVDGMARAMNECHTYYLDPNRAKGFNQRPAPTTGIGVQIFQPDPNQPIEVIDVIENTPAERAGVKKGDKIIRVNGEDVAKLTTDEVANRVRGPEGSQVTVTFLRGSQEVEFTITRARFQSPLVVSRMESDSIGYLSAKQLISSVAEDMAAAARSLSAQGATAWILDLRDDPGGELTVAVNVASLFIQRGTLVYQIGRDGQRTAVDANPSKYLGLNKPLVVLVNKNSASGSEIIAAGIRANGAGTVMGAQTAGCVGTGQPRELPDGGLLLVTLTKMQDAKTGADLNGPGKGVVPDRIVTDPADQQLLAAITFLRGHV